MSLDLTTLTALPAATSSPRKRRGRFWIGLGICGVAAAGAGWKTYQSGFTPSRYWSTKPASLEILSVDTGRLAMYVTETGSLESASNTQIRCQVEALLGMVGGTTGGTASRGGAGGAMAGGTGGTSGGTSSSGGASGGGMAGGAGGARGGSGGGARAGGASGGGGGGGASGGGGTGGGAGGASAGGATSGATNEATLRKPSIRSFNYAVTPYVPQRSSAGRSGGSTIAGGGGGGGGGGRSGGGGGGGGGGGRGGGGGGGGRGGGGGGGGGMIGDEKPGSTRIISILSEGTPVTKGQVVCELDSSSFKDELQSQRIKYEQAKSAVEQVQSILDVNLISYREYRDGIYPQDAMLIKQYINACRLDYDRAERNLAWSKDVYNKGFRAYQQYQADEFSLQRAKISLNEALGMEERLEKYTRPRLLKALEAKIESIKSDKYAQEAAFQLESDRLKRIERMIVNCTIRAPGEGIVVYANQTNSWGRTEAQIQEGVTVREGQPIFDLPDPNHMRVRAKINESKVAYIHQGQQAEIKIDAFPDRPLRGTVAEVTAIPAPSNGPFSDTRIYFAVVNIETGGFSDLRPGLSAEVSFFVDAKKDTTRVPVQGVRWVGDKPFVAVAQPRKDPEEPLKWEWKQVDLGLMNESYAEVRDGLKPGDQVVARPDRLPSPLFAAPSAPAPPPVRTAGGNEASPRS